jgi:hypothetical protein
MTSTDHAKLDLLMLAINERRLRGELAANAPLTPLAMERISIEIGVPVSRQKIARIISTAITKIRLHPSISAIPKS